MLRSAARWLSAGARGLGLTAGRSHGGYRSVYSLDRLYPKSGGESAFRETESQKNDRGTDVPVDRLTVTYCRSSGPGGQNVNKVNSKAMVRFHVATADWIPEDVRQSIISQQKNRINRSGELRVSSEVSRYQMRNLADCLQKIRDIVAEASRKPTQPSKEDAELRRMRVENMQRERLRQKKIHSSVKRDRRVDLD
eukprot:gi/632943438/ref/XP_007886948.1/ PREDICTED: peptidyl-tRNA hydrolase ICT1, mitochondrial isoform X1 [Callorhinchus milii]